MRKLKRVVLSIAVLSFLAVLMLHNFQEKLIFLPSQLPLDYEYSFAQNFEEFFLDTEDGARLNALHFKTKDSKGLILYFHGNAGDLSRWGKIASGFLDLGYDVLVMDYRTYGKSTGKLSEEALYSDAQLFYDHALNIYAEEDIIIYGRSLGTGIATQLASNNTPKKLILETPFYSLLDVAKKRLPFLPLKQVLKYSMPSFKNIQKVSLPICIFHGTDDTVVAYASGKKLFDVIPNPNKKMYTILGGAHNNLANFEVYWTGIREELR